LDAGKLSGRIGFVEEERTMEVRWFRRRGWDSVSLSMLEKERRCTRESETV